MKTLLVVMALALTGCVTTGLIGPEGEATLSVTCKGKAGITGTGHLGINAGMGGTQANSFTLQGDCGEGFEYTQKRERVKPD